jgi:phosphate transport system substrate-binding protein
MTKLFLSMLVAVGLLPAASAQNVLRLRGSDTLGAKLVPQWAEGFKKQGGGVNFDIAAEGSSTAFTNMAAGTADIGMSSRRVKDDERTFCKTKGVFLKEHEVCWDMIAVVVNKGNPLTNLSKKQVQQIFTGAIKDWSEVGGAPGPISIYTRNTSSGTYRDWMTLAMRNRDYATSSQKMAGNEQIAAEVGKNRNGIGYVGLAYTKAKGVKTVTIDGMDPSPANVRKYPYSRPTFLYTNGEPQGKIKEFLSFCQGPEGERIVQTVGFVPRSAVR